MSNPFRVGSTFTLSVPPTVMVVFGITGDLAYRKPIPAIYNLAVDRLLPANFLLVGFERRQWNDNVLREHIRQAVSDNS